MQRVEKLVTEAEMRQMIFDRMKGDKRCEGITRIGIYHLAEEGLPNWEVASIGGQPGTAAGRAVAEIGRKLAEEYDIKW